MDRSVLMFFQQFKKSKIFSNSKNIPTSEKRLKNLSKDMEYEFKLNLRMCTLKEWWSESTREHQISREQPLEATLQFAHKIFSGKTKLKSEVLKIFNIKNVGGGHHLTMFSLSPKPLQKSKIYFFVVFISDGHVLKNQ